MGKKKRKEETISARSDLRGGDSQVSLLAPKNIRTRVRRGCSLDVDANAGGNVPECNAAAHYSAQLLW